MGRSLLQPQDVAVLTEPRQTALRKEGRLKAVFAANAGIRRLQGHCFLYLLRRNGQVEPMLCASTLAHPRLVRRSPYVARRAPALLFFYLAINSCSTVNVNNLSIYIA